MKKREPIPSGRFVLRLPGELHLKLRERALKSGDSLNNLCIELIKIGLSEQSSTSGLFSKIERAAQEKYGDNFLGVILFGSAARGEEHAGSDIDILIVLSPELPIVRSLYDEWRDAFKDNVSISFSHIPAMPEDAGSLWLECALDGRIITDPQGRVGRILAGIKERITSGKIVRKVTHGQGYWLHV